MQSVVNHMKQLKSLLTNCVANHWGCIILWASALYVVQRWSVLLFEQIHYHVTYFAAPAIDGAFQLFDPLRRLAAGQTPGVDFQFFHGLGTLLVHYPIFTLFGGNLFASELSRAVISPLFFAVTSVVLLYVATRRALVAAVGLSILMLAFPLMPNLIITGVSLLGVRSALPLLAAAAIIIYGRQPNGHRRRVARAIVWSALGLSFVMSVEHGLAAIAAFILVNSFLSEEPWHSRLMGILQDVGGILLVIILSFLLISKGNVLSPLVYSLKDVPTDQFWYFGAPPNSAILSLIGLVTHWRLLILSAIALVTLGLWLKLKYKEAKGVRYGFVFLLVYGLGTTIAVLGIDSKVYLEPLTRATILAAICLSYFYARIYFRGHTTRSQLALVALGVALIGGSLLQRVPAALGPLRADSTPHTHALGIGLSDAWATHLKTINQTVPQGAMLWSTYAGLAEAQRGIFNPSGYDYIIHALGQDRRQGYFQKFDRLKPEYVNTIRRAYDPYGVYEEWIELSHWKLYESLVLNYEPKASTAFSHIWQKQGTWHDPADLGWLDEIKNPQPDVRLTKLPADIPEGSIVTVEVDYKIENKLGFLPLLGKTPRYFVAGYDSLNQAPVSLPPYETTWSFPVVTQAGHTPRIYPYVGSLLPGAHLHITALRYRILPLSQKVRETLVDRPLSQ